MAEKQPTKKELTDNFNKLRKICLKNAEDLLKGAEISLQAGIEHASFHLSVLALEEIGKVEIEAIRLMSQLQPPLEPMRYNLDTEDHEKKIFWALWGPSFGRQKQTKELLETNKDIAGNLHGRRLDYLYSDPLRPQHWSDLMAEGEAKLIFETVTARLKLEGSKSGIDSSIPAEEKDETLIWFLRANEDKEKIKEIWGHKSQEKLIEFGDVKPWIEWLKSTYEKNQEEMLAIAKKEMEREQPPLEQRLDPKWKVSFEIITPSHSIRQKNLKEFNDGVDWITLNYRDAHTLGVELLLSKNIQVQAIWDHGWGMARMFVSALNIATHGFFWWNIKKDTARWYEEIWDLENNAGVRIGPTPLDFNWQEKRFVLKPVDLSLVSIMFSYIADCWGVKKDEHLNRYVSGLSLLAKNDIHLRLDVNAFEEFFKALKVAMIENGDWDQKQPFDEAYLKANEWIKFSEMPPKVIEDMKKLFTLGFTVETEHKGDINLSAIYGMKEYCEIYFQTLALRFFKEKRGQDIKVVLGNEKDGDADQADIK